MNDIDYDKWVSSLKVGDKVAVHITSPLWERYEIRHVEKILKRGIRVDGFIPFTNGKVARDDGWSTRLEPIAEDIQDVVDRRVLLAELSRLEMKKLSTEQLREIKRVVEG